ncbi:hypothetical protein [Polaribacter sp. P097]|uniref:hypothetical protein n=1 Tax=Polaribacter sp. P097 TaxID=3117398 RepID=UPI002FDF6D08
MKIKPFLLYLLLFSIGLNIYSQEKNIENSFKNYFENTREIPYLHLNKTTFLLGEKLWFQAYVNEQNTSKLHPNTTNLYVTVFEETGKKKSQQLIKIKNGIGRGSIDIDSTFINKNYYVKATTNWMLNFKENNSYQQKISVLTSEKNKEEIVSTYNEEDYFEFQLFPEGGHYLVNAENTVGILLKDANNKGLEIKEGIIKNSDGEFIDTFSTNKFGLGKVSFYLPEDDIYTFEVEFSNGLKIENKIIEPRTVGVLLKTTQTLNGVEILIETNPITAALLKDKAYTLFVHNTRSYKKYNIEFNAENTRYLVALKKENIEIGMNVITLFNEEKNAICERVFYNENPNLFFDVKLNQLASSKDSITIRIVNDLNEKVYLSTSFLPNNTKAYKPQNTIKSAFILNPFVRGQIENPEYYFNQNNTNRLQELDLLLITQGWGKYSWKNIFEEIEKTKYDFEQGIDVKFTLNNAPKKNQTVIVYSDENDLIVEMKPDNKELFIDNSFLIKDSKFNFGLKTNNNTVTKIGPSLTYSKSSITDILNKTLENESNIAELEISNFKSLTDGISTLDEVIVKTKRVKNEANAFGIATMLTTFRMDDMLVTSGDLVLNFLSQKRFDVQVNNGDIFIGKRRPDRNHSMSGNSDNYTRQLRNVRVYLDGSEITQSLWILDGLYLNTIKSISFGQDPSQFNEVIYMYSLSAKEYSRKNSEFKEFFLPVGFSKEIEYYSPKYPSFLDQTYINYGAIFWKPLISIDKNSMYDFKVPINQQKNIKVYLEGISSSGKLITKEVKLSSKKPI